MTSQGSARARFQRAVKRRHLLAAETAARELGTLSLSVALSLCLLIFCCFPRYVYETTAPPKGARMGPIVNAPRVAPCTNEALKG